MIPSKTVFIGLTFYGDKTTKSKEIRANPLSSSAEAGNVKLIRGPYITEFVGELEAFPNYGVHKDQADAASGAFNRCSKMQSHIIVEDENENRKESARSKYA